MKQEILIVYLVVSNSIKLQQKKLYKLTRDVLVKCVNAFDLKENKNE